ncbi:hypothetical protein B0H19DRAFT_1171032 [Mycena capillaripes]|nr:hypothetical protein B0H19DRAFT_1171032 [Mycena capillaripes]
MRAILAVFDKPGFDDAEPKTREQVVALMAEMQSFRSPPPSSCGPSPSASALSCVLLVRNEMDTKVERENEVFIRTRIVLYATYPTIERN